MPPTRFAWVALAAVAIAAGIVVAAMDQGSIALGHANGMSSEQARAWELVDQLESADRTATNEIMWELYRIGEPAAPALISLIRDDCSNTSMDAGVVLDALGVRSIPYYVGALDHPNPRVRSAAAIWLALLGMWWGEPDEWVQEARPAIPRLIAMLNDEDERLVSSAGSALRNLLEPSDARYVAELQAALRRQSQRFAARERMGSRLYHHEPAHALAAIGPAALPALRECLRDPLQETREAALVGLRFMGPEAAPAVPDIVELVQAQLDHGLPEEPRLPEEKALMEDIGGEPGIPLLFDAGQALGAIGEDAAPALPVLLEWMERDDIPRRWQAVAAIGGIGPGAEPAVPALIRALHVDEFAGYAPQALAGVGPAAIPALRAALDHEATRVGALRALGLMGDAARAAGPDARAFLDSPYKAVRCQAAAALWQIGHAPRAALPILADDCPKYREALRNPGDGAAEAVTDLFARFVDDPKRWDYSSALAEMGDVAVPPLAEALRHDSPTVRGAAAGALYRSTGDLRPAMEPLANALIDRRDGSCATHGRALLRIGSAAAPVFPQVIAALAQEDDPEARFVLFEILLTAPEHAGDAIPMLERAREDESFFTRIWADQALIVVRGE